MRPISSLLPPPPLQPGPKSGEESKALKRCLPAMKLIAWNIVFLALGISVLEIVFGGWFQEKNLSRLNILRNYESHRDVSGLYEDENPVIKYSRDRYGLRGTFNTPSQINILTVGGSTTDQRRIRDGETWQDWLENGFRQSGREVTVANAGVDGQSTFGHIANFEHWFPEIPRLAPTHIIFYVGINDFHVDPASSYDDVFPSNESLGPLDKIKSKSAIWQTAKILRGTYEARFTQKLSHRSIDFSVIPWTSTPIQNSYDFLDARTSDYGIRLKFLAEKASSMGAKPVFVSQPTRYYRRSESGLTGQDIVKIYDGLHKYNGVDYYFMTLRFNSKLELAATQSNGIFIDLTDLDSWADEDFYDSVHMTPRGAKKLGLILHEFLKDEDFSRSTRIQALTNGAKFSFIGNSH